jgi:hypothetical protein
MWTMMARGGSTAVDIDDDSDDAAPPEPAYGSTV